MNDLYAYIWLGIAIFVWAMWYFIWKRGDTKIKLSLSDAFELLKLLDRKGYIVRMETNDMSSSSLGCDAKVIVEGMK